MDNKRLSLSNLHDQIDSLRSSEWPTMKRYFRRQIVKCINECKTQACNAKKLVDNIKDHTKTKGSERTDDDDDDDVGWGSDFDTDDDNSDDNEDPNQQNINIKGKNVEYNLHKSCEDMGSQPFSYLSNGSFRSLDESQLKLKDNNENRCEERQQINESLVNHRLTDRTNSENSVLVDTNLIANQIQNKSTFSLNEKPKPATKPRSLPKPPATKPEVPKNKPQIVPRKPNINNLEKPAISPKRPPSEPPPPPLPKSPPPMSPSAQPTDLDAILNEAISYLQELNSETKVEETNYETLPDNEPEDEYLTPNEITFELKRKNSSSTISSQSTGYSTGLRDESPNGNSLSLSTQTLNQLSTNVNSFEDKEETVVPIVPIVENFDEQNYEEVNVNNQNDLLVSSQRPPLPKIKEQTNSSKTKRIPDFWNKNQKEKKNINFKDKNDNESGFEDNSMPSLPIEPINPNNSHGITTRPLPPLPPLPSLHPTLPPHSLTSSESLRDHDWFHEVEREDAETLLMTQDEDGAYLVRESKRAGKSNPYTLTIFHNGRVFHLNIRKRPDGLFALGKEKSREKTFKTVADLVFYHTTEPILLTTRGTPAGKTRLISTPSSCN